MDEELLRLTIDELERKLLLMIGESDAQVLRRTLHSIKGSLGLVGKSGLSSTIARFERRVAGGDLSAAADAIDLLRKVIAALRIGEDPPEAVWPVPPADLRSTPRDPALDATYVEAVHDRLTRVDGILASDIDDRTRALELYRETHAVKGAALGVGDEVMAWFCHGLEEQLRRAQFEPGAARQVMREMTHYRSIVAEICDLPDRALETLRRVSSPPSLRPGPLSTSTRPPDRDARLESDARGLAEAGSFRVATSVLEGMFERGARLREVHAPLLRVIDDLVGAAGGLQRAHEDLRTALRLIGPPRPWGAPQAALDRVASAAEATLRYAKGFRRSKDDARAASTRLVRESEGMLSAVSAIYTTQASELFDTITNVVVSYARHEGKDIRFSVTGGDVLIDKRLAEALVDPLLQLARNAVAHGLETPSVRALRNKTTSGTISLRAQVRAGFFVIEVSDDGAGVDIGRVREEAIRRGLVASDIAAELPDRALLSLLFVPGLTTIESADLLAGRGVGLDLTMSVVHRLGGTVHLATRAGLGFTATISVPATGVMVKVAWVRSAGATFALPLVHTGRVVRREEATEPTVSLAHLLGKEDAPARFAIEILDTGDLEASLSAYFAIDAVLGTDEVALRPLPAMLRLLGPYSSAIQWGDELRMGLDPTALVALAASQGATQRGTTEPR